QAEQDGDAHHEQDGEHGVVLRQLGDAVVRQPEPYRRRQQRPQAEEDRDVDEVVQGGFRDVRQPFEQRFLLLVRVGVADRRRGRGGQRRQERVAVLLV